MPAACEVRLPARCSKLASATLSASVATLRDKLSKSSISLLCALTSRRSSGYGRHSSSFSPRLPRRGRACPRLHRSKAAGYEGDAGGNRGCTRQLCGCCSSFSPPRALRPTSWQRRRRRWTEAALGELLGERPEGTSGCGDPPAALGIEGVVHEAAEDRTDAVRHPRPDHPRETF